MDRFVICSLENAHMAWSGSHWVPHIDGIPTGGVQVSNFSTWKEAARYALEVPLALALFGISEDGGAICCFICGSISFNRNDVHARYCAHCKLFLDDLLPALDAAEYHGGESM